MLKPIARKFEKRKIHSPFIDNIWGADLVHMQLISKLDNEVRFLLFVIDMFSKCPQVILLKDKKGTTIANAFQKNLKESNCKPNKIWADKGSKFSIRSMKSFLENNNIEM